MDDVLSHIASQEEATLSTLSEFLRIPSVSADPACAGEVRRCALWLADRFREAGFAAGAHPTGRSLADRPAKLVHISRIH